MDNDNIIPEYIKGMNLNEVERAFQNGLINEQDIEAYLKAWNATPGRFTIAIFTGYCIRQKNK